MFKLLRRKPEQEEKRLGPIVLSGREIDLCNRRVIWNGDTHQLTPLSVEALLFLVSNKNRWVSANEIFDELTRECFGEKDFGPQKPEQLIQRVITDLKRSLQGSDDSLISRRIDDTPPFTEWYRLIGTIS